MMQPLGSVINGVIGSSIRLVGGLFMCFYTSFELTILSLTIVGPIIYITNRYAAWSRAKIFDQRSVTGDANSVVVETFNNIQTVKTFSTEKMEYKRYNDFNKLALEKGIKVALLGK